MQSFRVFQLAAVTWLSLTLSGCEQIEALLGPSDSPELAQPAEALLKKGDLPGAKAQYDALSQANPDSVHVAMGRAYVYVLAGKYGEADSMLAAVDKEDLDPELRQQLHLRRALVALQTGEPEQLDKVKKFGKSSGLPAGQILAAEVFLADAESDKAKPLLEKVQGASGPLGQTAQTYLELLGSEDPVKAQLAEATALWALGSRNVACEVAEDLLKNLPADDAERDGLLLTWAGRAATSGHPSIAEGLLDEIGVLPEEQVWRKQATLAIVHIARASSGAEDVKDPQAEIDKGIAIFVALAEAGAPKDGLADALATAAALTTDKTRARELTQGLESSAAARSLWAAGAPVAAKRAAPPASTLSRYLENQ